MTGPSSRHWLASLTVERLICLVFAILGHQCLAQSIAQGCLASAQPIGQTRQDPSSGASFSASGPSASFSSGGGPSASFDGSGLVEISMSGLNPYYGLAQSYFPQTLPAMQADLTNYYKYLSQAAQNGYNGVQSGFQYANDNSMNRYKQLQNSFNANYVNGEELVRRMYEMLSNPQQMCNQLANQSQAALKAAGQLPQQVGQQAGQSLNQVAQSSDSLLGSVGNMLNKQPASSLLNKIGSFSLGKK